MRVLWLEPEPPIPPLTGGRERARRVLTYVAQRHDLYLVTFADAAEEQGLLKLRQQLAGITAVPYPARPQNPSAGMRQAVQDAMRQFNPDAIHVCGLDLWPYAPDRVRRILDLHDAPCLLQSRLSTIQPSNSLLSAWRQRRNLLGCQRRESAALRAASAVIVVSETDRQALSLPDSQLTAPVIVIPNGISLTAWPQAVAAPDPAVIFFPGALNWLPNIDAVQVLVRLVLPLVREQLPEAHLVVAGRLPAEAVVQLAVDNPYMTLIADPPEMYPLFARATVVAVPLRAGAGSRLKILQALAVGRPVLSTPLGAEGLGLENGRHLITAPLVIPFANALIEMLTDARRCQALSQAGRACVARFDWQHHLPGLDTIYG